jgi:hypothetical protein
MEAADLKIVPPNPVALPGLAYFRYRAPGDSFTPYPGVAEVSGIEMPVNYLAGYGAARGTILSASTRRTAATASAGSLAPYIAQAGAIYQQHLDQALDYQDYLAQAYEIWRNAWGDVVSPALQALGNDCNPGEMESVFKMALEFRELDPETDPRWQGYSHAIFDSIHDSVLTCIDKAYQRCKANNDPTEVMLIQKLSTLLQRIGQVTDAEYADIVAKVDGCLRFELDFESGLTVTYSAAGVPVTERLKVRAITPLQLEASDKKFILKGSAPIAHEFVSVTAPPCSDTVATKPGTFNVERLDLGLFEEVTTPVSDSTEIRPAPRDQISVDMVYSPGNPQEQLTSTCPGPFGPITGTGSFTGVFAPFFAQLHPDEAIGQTDFIVIKWQPIRSGNIFATLTYDRSVSLSGVNTSEETFVTLKHTPQ